MRVGHAVVVVAVLLGACSSGDRRDFGPPVPTAAPTSTVLATSTTLAPATAPSTDPPGSVTLRVTAFTLPDLRSGGSGLRLLVRASSARLTLRRRGGGGSVTACPVASPTTPVTTVDCVDLAANGAAEVALVGGVGGGGGVELRSTGPDATVDEVSVTYLPAARATTIVTPARPAGACSARACEMTFAFLPGGAGAFTLDGRATGGQPRFVLSAVTPTGSPVSNRTLATVEGGGSLSIRATVDAGSEARLLQHEQGGGPTSPVTAEILWP